MPELSYPDIATFAGPLYVAFILVEAALIAGLFARKWRAKGRYERNDALSSIALGTGNAISGFVFASTAYAAIYWVLFQFYQFTPLKLGTSLWVIVLAFVVNDFAYYWSHRFGHEVRWFWANHIVHHSSQHYNLSTALRQPWFSFTTGLFVLKIPLILLGFHPAIIAFVGSLNLFYQFFIHTETIGTLPRPIEWLMNTPSHHRVHHGRNPRYLDANYAGVFIIWDKMFGTFVAEEKSDPVEYGIVTNFETLNPFKVAVLEYGNVWRDLTQSGVTWQDRWQYLFNRPGWSHDDTRETSVSIKARWAEAGFPPHKVTNISPSDR